MDPIKNDLVPNGGGIPSKQAIYAYASRFAQEAIDVLVAQMRDSRMPQVKVGAAKSILDKCVPDLKATEITGEGGGEVLIRLITEADAKSNSGSTDQELPSPAVNL